MDVNIETIWWGRSAAARLARILLMPLSWVFAMISTARTMFYRRGWLHREQVEIPVVSVGNLSVGGTGKTPLVTWLAIRLRIEGFHPVVVSRGYGGKARRPVVINFDPAWTLPAEFGHRVFRPRSYFEAFDAAGDEAVLIARRAGCPVVVFRDRAEACRTARDCYEPDCILLDDGFQHLRLRRDLDIVILAKRDAESYRLPAGPLREGLDALARADVVVHVGDSVSEPSMRRVAAGLVARPDADAEVESLQKIRGKTIGAVAAIADPREFFCMLEAAGAHLVVRRRFRDHYDYTIEDWQRIEKEAAEAGAEMVVTTEKDLVKLERFAGVGSSLRAIRLDLEVSGGEELVARIGALDANHGHPHDRSAVA